MTLIRKTNNFFPSTMDNFFSPDFFKIQRQTANVDFSAPAVNVKEDENSFTVELAAPGMKRDDFKVEVDHGNLVISSEKEQSKDEKDEQGKYTRKEFSYQSFRRAFTLPERMIDSEKVLAKYENGILYVNLPKREESKVKPVKQIAVQ